MFTAETELAAPVEQWLRQQGSSCVAHEVVSEYGIPDLVAGVGLPEKLRRRRKLASPITDPNQLALLEFCSSRRTVDELRKWAPIRFSSYVVRTLEPLLQEGLLSQTAKGIKASKRVTDPFEALIAVELKLSATKHGFAQAMSYRLFAETSYFAVPSRCISPLAKSRATELGIGLLAVNETGCELIVAPSGESIATESRRRITSERVIAASNSTQGRRAGSPLHELVTS